MQYEELPYFDSAGNDYVSELRRQDAYVKRGGKLSAPQMIKYENRVAMLVERLIVILEAVKQNPEDLHDYLEAIEQHGRTGALPKEVYSRFKEKVDPTKVDQTGTERDRDRFRVITGGATAETNKLAEMTIEQLIELYEQKTLAPQGLFEEFSKREKAGTRLPRMGGNLWGKYRSWVAEKRRIRRMRSNNEG